MNNKLVLGTVQFGLNYGINNTSGKPAREDVFEMLDNAFEKGIEFLDTADAYGDAIQLIGDYHRQSSNKFKVLSKFKNVKGSELKKQAEEGLRKLELDNFEVYSFHSYKDFAEDSSLALELLKLKESKLVLKTGISIYTNEEFERTFSSESIDVIQIPYNLLDNNNQKGGLINKAKLKGKEIHIRSVFLQGLLFADKLPQKLEILEPYLITIRKLAYENNITVSELALSYPFFNPQIDKVLIGVDNKQQLLENLNLLNFKPEAFEFIDKNIIIKESSLLNPVNW